MMRKLLPSAALTPGQPLKLGWLWVGLCLVGGAVHGGRGVLHPWRLIARQGRPGASRATMAA